MRYEIRKKKSSLPPGERFLHALAANPRDEPAAELDSGWGIGRQGSTKVPGVPICHNRGELIVRGVRPCE